MVNSCAVCGCCTRTDIVREHLEDTLRICDVSAKGHRELAKIAGFINSLCLAVGPPVRLFSRHLFFIISQRDLWAGQLDCVPPLLMEELRFWLTNLCYLNGYNIRPKESLEPLTIHTDASGVGYGGYFASLRDVNIHGHWSAEQSGKSSTFRELLAILLVLRTSVKHLQHKKVKIFSDSQSACRIVQVGSRILELQNIEVDIFNICFINDIMIETQWIPRAENRIADVLSKTIDLDDWKLNPELFAMLHRAWGPFTIDRFAASYNTQLYHDSIHDFGVLKQRRLMHLLKIGQTKRTGSVRQWL